MDFKFIQKATSSLVSSRLKLQLCLVKLLVFPLLFIVAASQSSFAQCTDPTSRPNDTFTVTGWAPQCNGGNNGFIRITGIGSTVGAYTNGPYIARILTAIGGTPISTYPIPAGSTTFDITGLTAGNYVVDIADQCSGTSSDKPVTIAATIAPSYTLLPIGHPYAGFLERKTVLTCGDTYVFRVALNPVELTGQTITATFTNNLGATITGSVTTVRTQSYAAGQTRTIDVDLPIAFFNGLPLTLTTSSDVCGNTQSLSVPYPGNGPLQMATTVVGANKAVQSTINPCLSGYDVTRSRRLGTNPITATIEITGGGAALDIDNVAIPNFNGNVDYGFVHTDNGGSFVDLGTKLFGKLKYGTSYTINYTDGCGLTSTEIVNLAAPVVGVATATCVGPNAFGNTASMFIDNTGVIIMSLPNPSAVQVAPYTFTVNSGPTTWTSTLGLNPVSTTITYPIVYTFPTRPANGQFVIGNHFPPGNYNITYSDNCGNTNTINYTMGASCAVPYNTVKSLDYCNSTSTVDLSYSVTGPLGRRAQWISLYNSGGTLIQSKGQFSFQPATFTGLAPGTYTVRFGGKGSANTDEDSQSMPNMPRLPSGHFYEEQVVIAPLVALSFATITTCNGTATGVGAGGVAPLRYSLLNSNGTTVLQPTQTSGTFSGLTAGVDYRMRVIDACGRTFNQNFVVDDFVNAPTIGTVVQPTCASANNSVQLTNLPGGNWTITDSNGGGTTTGTGSTLTLTNIAAGAHTFTVTVDGGCTSGPSATVTINSPTTPSTPTIGVGAITQPTCTTPTGSVVLSNLPAIGDFTITDTNGGATYPNLSGTSTTITNLTPGIHNFTVTNSDGCTSATASADVEILPVAGTPNVMITNPTAVCAPTTIDLTAPSVTAGSTPGLTYTYFTNPAGTIVLANPNAVAVSNTYYIKGTNGVCSDIKPVVVTVNPLPVVAAIGNTGDVCIGKTRTLTNTTTGGVWTSATPAVATIDAATGMVTGISAGTSLITYTVTNGNSCVTAVTYTITVNPLPVVAAIGNTGDVCLGKTRTLTNATTGGVWTSATPTIATIDAASGTVTGVSAGTSVITYTVTNGNGCETAVTCTITVNPLPVVAAIGNTGDVCVGKTRTLSNPTAGGVWSSATPTIATIDAAGMVTGVSAGTSVISYTVTNANQCETTVSYTITINPLPVVAAIGNTGDVCVGKTRTLSNATTGGVWTSATPTIATINSATGMVTGVSAGTSVITYTVTNNNSCTTAVTYTITVNPLTVVAAIANTGDVCVGKTRTLTNATTGGVWTSASPAIATINATTGEVTGVSAGNSVISYTVTNANQCETTVSYTITVNPLPATPVVTSSGNSNTICPGTSVTLTSTTAVGYQWYRDGQAIANANGRTYQADQSGSYTVAVTDANCTSLVSNAITITVGDLTPPIQPTLSDVTAECSTTVTAPTTTDNCSGVVTGTTTNPLSYSQQGLYQIVWTFTDAAGNSVEAVQKVTIKDTTKPVRPVLADVAGECSVTLTPPVTTDNCAGSITGTTNTVFPITTIGVTMVTWTFSDGNGNTETAQQRVTVTNVAAPIVAVTAQPSCTVATGTINITPVAGVSYSVDGGAYSSSISYNLAPGVHTITARGASGCTSTATTITINPQPALPTASIAYSPGEYQAVGTATVLQSGQTGGTYTASPSGLSINPTTGHIDLANSTPNQSYTVTYTFSNGTCSSSTTTTVRINGRPATVGYGSPAYCAKGTATINRTGPTGGTYSASPSGLSINAATGEVNLGSSRAGSYTVTYTYQDGTIKASATTSITVNALPVLTLTSDIPSGNTVSLGDVVTLTATGGVTYSWTGDDIQSGQGTSVIKVRPRQGTTYTVTATNANGCSETMQITINLVADRKIIPNNVITPNGDGKNDTWVVKNLDYYPNNTVTIYDRAGRKIYSVRGYKNDWDGSYNGQPLAEDAYIYVIDSGKGIGLIRGTINIIRDQR